MPLYLPVAWKVSAASSKEAMSRLFRDFATSVGEMISDASTIVSEDHDVCQDECSEDGSNRNLWPALHGSVVASGLACEQAVLPPQRTPSIPSMSSSPPPPPTCFPHVPDMESCFTSPSRGVDEVFSLQTSALSTSPCQECRPAQTLFEA